MEKKVKIEKRTLKNQIVDDQIFEDIKTRKPVLTLPDNANYSIYFMTPEEEKKYSTLGRFQVFAVKDDKVVLLVEKGMYQITKDLFKEPLFDFVLNSSKDLLIITKKYSKLYLITAIAGLILMGILYLIPAFQKGSTWWIPLLISAIALTVSYTILILKRKAISDKSHNTRIGILDKLAGGNDSRSMMDTIIRDYAIKYYKKHEEDKQ